VKRLVFGMTTLLPSSARSRVARIWVESHLDGGACQETARGSNERCTRCPVLSSARRYWLAPGLIKR
jgi:hypothetical protein